MKLAAKCLSSITGVMTILVSGAALAAPPPIRLASGWDLKELGRDFPQALAAFKQADAVAAAGRAQEAAALFEQVARLAPRSPAPVRRQCELLTDLGQRDQALRACRQTIALGDAPEDYRAMVGALMAGSSPPSSDDFVQALLMAGGVVNRTPTDPAGHAAMFDIAWRLGDRHLMRSKLRELESTGPDHYETGRARRIVAGLGPGPLALAGWGALLALALLTAARGIGRLRLRARPRPSPALTVTVALLLLAGGPARAEETPVAGHLSEFKINDDDPEGSLPPRAEFKKDPLQYGYLIMDLADRADERLRRKDHEGAAKFYRAIAKVAPDRAIGWAKVCEVYELAGQRSKALDACRRALVIEGARAEDYERFVRLTLSGPGTLSQTDQAELGNIVNHLRKTPDAEAAAADLECRIGVRMGDVQRLQRCTSELTRLAPDNQNAIGYEWALATLRQDGTAAERALARATKAGISLAGVERMQSATRRAELTRVVSYGLAAAFILAAAGLLLRRRRELSAGLARRSPT